MDSKTKLFLATISGPFLTLASLPAQDVLPFPPTPSTSETGLTMKTSIYQKRVTPSRLGKDAPNILVVLIDDAGPAAPDTCGGEIHTPNLSKVAKLGISYNRFHSTAMCSPTRASIPTGRNHTVVGNGQIAEFANDWDGFSGTIPKTSAMELFRQVLFANQPIGDFLDSDYTFLNNTLAKAYNIPFKGGSAF